MQLPTLKMEANVSIKPNLSLGFIEVKSESESVYLINHSHTIYTTFTGKYKDRMCNC